MYLIRGTLPRFAINTVSRYLSVARPTGAVEFQTEFGATQRRHINHLLSK
jgi:hypothetical protein